MGGSSEVRMETKIWSRRPPVDWKDGYPVGNGELGAMALGDGKEVRLALNHEWLWRANHRHRDIPPLHDHLPKLRELLFAGKLVEAAELANRSFNWPPPEEREYARRVDPYQPAGDFRMAFEGFRTLNFRRELDLARAVATVEHEFQGAVFRRECFAHAARPVIVLRLSGSEPGRLTGAVSLTRCADAECRVDPWSEGDRFGFTGTFVEGSRFAVAARACIKAGECRATPGFALRRLKHADEAFFLITMAVSHDGADPRAECLRRLDDVPADFDALLAEHVEAHGRMYNRVTLDLRAAPVDRPIDERLAALRAGGADDGLPELYFNFARYLLISSSRPGGLPANLQGIWNDAVRPPWDSDFHHDINLQMNYWPAEAGALPECIEPLFDHVERFLPHGREAARKLYDCRGVLLPLQTDPWGRCTCESMGWGVWIGAAAWLAQHFWWRWEYGRDERFLRERAYPLLREIAAFYEDYLVRDPQGRLVPAPSQSPENAFVGGARPVSLCVGATMDLELIHEALTHAIAAAETLGLHPEDCARWRGILKDLSPLQVGRHGQLQEWLEDYEEVEPGHRHISHLYSLFPGDRITPEATPDLARAAQVSLERRLAAKGGHTGWSRAWIACCWARLRHGDAAREHLAALLREQTSDALLDLHPPGIFQIDGNFGGGAAVGEMLMQSHGGVIRLLPALPRAWPAGRVTGLRARGGFGVDIEWEAGRPLTAVLRAETDAPCRFTAPGCAPEVACDGRPVALETLPDGIWGFAAERGRNYLLRWTARGETA